MNTSSYRKYWLLSLVLVIAISSYPLYMGFSVFLQVARLGAVAEENYPKYIIPYTPIALSLIFGVAMMPLLQKISRKLDLLYGAVLSSAVFFLVERLMETKILVKTTELFPLESWQMSLCYVPPEGYRTRTWQAVDVLLGGYSPGFKFHFYLISAVIILSLLNCFYGFGKMIRNDDWKRKKALTIQGAASILFLGMCIWACFTAFYRTGEITVSPLSAVLMIIFFILLGVTAGVFTGSFVLGKRKVLFDVIPAVTAILVTTAMYVGEMILLSKNLYRFGKGFLFEGLGKLVLAPIDILAIFASGAITFLICRLFRADKEKSQDPI